MAKQFKFVIFIFLVLGVLAFVDLMVSLFTTRSVLVTSVTTEVTNSRTYYLPCIAEIGFCEKVQGSIKSFEVNDQIWIHRYLNFGDLPLLILPSKVSVANYELIKYSIWTGIPFVEIGFAMMGLVFVIVFARLKFFQSKT